MKIREVRAQNLRNFGPDAPAVSFVDPDTHQVRPLTILVGANGSGKTTLLELIEAMSRAVVGEIRLGRLSPGRETVMSLNVQFPEAADPAQVHHLRSVGLPGQSSKTWAAPGFNLNFSHEDFRDSFQISVLHFPSSRSLPAHRSGAISRPQESQPWIFRYLSGDGYEGSLSQLWVWQNYLDLEAQAEGHPNLLPFVEAIQTILSEDQTIKIQRGEVWIERPRRGDRVRPHELPSGEQQVLVLFGEIIRRLKPGSIVMIDELEISLHPALQRVVLYHLRRLAKLHDLQIILTTHSLEIVADADPSEIVNLDDMVFTEFAARTDEAAE